MPRAYCRILFGGVSFLVSCLLIYSCAEKRPTVDEPVVAWVGNQPITATQLQREMFRQGLTPASELENEHYRRQALDTLITDAALQLAAGEMDLSDDHVLRLKMQQHVLQLTLKHYADLVIAPQLELSDSAIDSFWQANPDKFIVPHTIVDFQEISIYTDLKDLGGRKPLAEYQGWSAERIVQDIYQRLKNGENFDTLALAYSFDAFSRGKGGRYGWAFYDSNKVSPRMDSLFAFPVGRIMPPFQSGRGYYIIRINRRLEPGELMAPDADMRSEIAVNMTQKRRTGWIGRYTDSLLRAGHLEIVSTNLALPQAELTSDLVIAISNKRDTTFGDAYAARLRLFHAEDGSKNFKAKDKKRLVENMHQLLCVWKAMADVGWLARPEFAGAQQEFLLEAAAIRIKDEAVERSYTPSEKEVELYYLEHRYDFESERPIHVQHIVFDDWDTAMSVKQRVDDGADFLEQARLYFKGDPEMLEVSYDLGFISAQDISVHFFAKALQLDEGEISEPVQSDWGYHLIRVVERDQGTPKHRAWQLIKDRLVRASRAKAYSNWRTKLVERFAVEILPEALAAVPVLDELPDDTTTTVDPSFPAVQ